jgi:hypothetical protein
MTLSQPKRQRSAISYQLSKAKPRAENRKRQAIQVNSSGLRN